MSRWCGRGCENLETDPTQQDGVAVDQPVTADLQGGIRGPYVTVGSAGQLGCRFSVVSVAVGENDHRQLATASAQKRRG